MRITYDDQADAAYFQVVDSIGSGEACEQLGPIATPGGQGEVLMDFDREGRLLGIEVLNAGKVLDPDLLAAAVRR